jgi:glycosidase
LQGQMADPRRDSWFNDGPTACVCGDPECDWGAKIETCWFGPELPDLNWRNPEVVAAGVDDLVWWMQRFQLDGLRLDAVPMMPRAATRRIVRAVRSLAPGSLLVGEDYTGPGEGGRQEIRAYLGRELDGLDSAFDFPLMWAARRAIAQADPAFGFDALEREVEAGARAWLGADALIAHMLDNHDTTRFASESAGDAGGDPWLAPPPQSSDPEIYARQLLGLAFVLTLPGLPVIYYGDELALAGATDPDSRRVMPDVLGSLPPLQRELVDQVARLGRARQCLGSERRVLHSDADHHVALRGQAVIVLSRDRAPTTLALPMLPNGRLRDVVSGAEIDLPGPLPVSPLTAAVWLPAEDPCWERAR